MKVEMGKIPIKIAIDSPSVGDVYRAKNGRGKTKFFVIIAIFANTAHALGLNADGDIVRTASYGTHIFASRDIVGRVSGLAEMRLDIEWKSI